ncbi:MAG TPA: ATP-binding protein [Actinomycetospora sp.]|nr:ATP-binding protein [Actinomycetospora sp.]
MSTPSAPADLPTTAGELARSGHPAATPRSVRTELRDNLLARLRAGVDPWPGIVGFDRTVLPQFERAVLAGHDVVLLGERGQGKTRLLRSLVALLDEWTPVIAGSEIGEHPGEPIVPASRRRVAEMGDDLPISWRHRSERYAEKLATPDTSVADLIGDVDPVKVAEGRSLGDPETIHYGLVPRAHRGIVTINELPDLAERIQVALLNVMEERDIQVRGYTLRLPLDIMLVASANPEDYTNRGRIITPLKDRFGAEVRTHYPLEIAGEIALVRQEAHLVAEVPDHLVEVIARFTRHLRSSGAIDQRSGVSARFSIAAAETVAAAALRRSAVTGEDAPVARPVDLEAVPPVLRGKLEFESGEEGREDELLTHLLRRSISETARARLAGVDLSPLAEGVSALEGDRRVVTGDRVAARQVVDALPSISVVYTVAERLGAAGTEAPGPLASAVELALEHLYLTRKLAKDDDADEGTVTYGG